MSSLRAWQLGDMSIPVKRKADQLRYLRSCRNHVTLRNAVLEEFVSAGRTPAGSVESETPDVWGKFTRSLTRTLTALENSQYLILSLGPRAASVGRTERFVQFASFGDDGLRAETVSNAFLDGDARLSADDQRALAVMGWCPPTHAPGAGEDQSDPLGSPNYFRDWPTPVPHIEVAQFAVATLRDVHGARASEQLRYVAFDEAGAPLLFSKLGLRRVEEIPSVDPAEIEALLPSPRDAEDLRKELEATVRGMLQLDELYIDADGDIPIKWGTTSVFVRVSKAAPVVNVFAPLIVEVPSGAALLEAANSINQRYNVVRAFVEGDSMLMAADVMARPYVSAHVVETIQLIGEIADELDEELQSQLGGRTFHGEALSLPSGPPKTTPGYLT